MALVKTVRQTLFGTTPIGFAARETEKAQLVIQEDWAFMAKEQGEGPKRKHRGTGGFRLKGLAGGLLKSGQGG